MKITWNALSDIVSVAHGINRKISEAPQRQPHEADEEKRRKRHNTMDHFSLGNEMHEIAGHKERFSAGNHQGQNDVPDRRVKGDKRGPDGKRGANDQGHENIYVAPDMV